MFCSVLLLAIFAFVIPQSANAALYWRQTNGPYGGFGHAIGISKSDPSTIYLGTAWSGIYVSIDSGESWTIKKNGLTDIATKVNDIAVNPDDASIAYAATAGSGVAKTVNKGDLWQPKNNNLPVGYIYAIAIDPLNTKEVYAATYSGVQKSTDEGDSWSSAGLGGLGEILCLRTVSGGDHSVIYAGSNGGGLWKSTDEAAHWTPILPGISVYAIGESRSSPESYIYAGVFDTNTWGIYKTTNEAVSWTTTGFPDAIINFISVNSVSPEVAYAATNNFLIYKTNNGGSTWAQKSSGVEDTFINKIAIDPSNNSRIYASGTFYETYAGRAFYVSTNEGGSWTFKNKGINNVYLGSLLVATSESGTPVIYAGAYPLGVFRSTDEGGSWQEKNNGISSTSGRFVNCLAQDPNDPATILAGVSDINSTAGCVYKSTNEGESWAQKGPNVGHVFDIKFDKVSPEVVYAGTYSGGTIFRSSDEGETWSGWDASLPAVLVYQIITSSYEGKSYVHIGIGRPFSSDQSLYYRRNALDPLSSWEATSLLGGANAFAPNYGSPEYIYAGLSTNLYSKTLEAKSWNGVLSLADSPMSIAADPGDPSTLYAMTHNRGIFKISGFGNSAVRDEAGLQDTLYGFGYPKPLVTNTYSNPRQLYAEVNARSVWKATEYSQSIPPAPSDVTGSALSPSSIRWNWTDNSLIEQGFKLYSSDASTVIVTMPQNIISTTEGTLQVNKPYQRLVAALMSGVPDQFSGLSPLVYTLANAPGIPSSKEVGRQTITITWEANGNPHNISLNTTSYEVYRSTTEVGSGLPIDWQHVSTITTTEYPDTGLSFETKYYYRVRALNGNGIPTGFMTSEGYTTGPPIPSDDVLPPRITRVRFNDRLYFSGDIIYHTPRISAVITDYASHEPDWPINITPEGVKRDSVRISFNDYVFDVPIASVLPQGGNITVEVNYQLPARLGSTTYICTIEATDNAYPWYNKATWTGVVRVMGDRPSIVGEPVAYPMPFRPLTDKMVTMSYTLSTNADVTLYMYNVSGQIVMTRKFRSGGAGGKAGYNQFTWNGITDFNKTVGNGIYVYKIISKGKSIGTGKLVVLD